MAYDDPGRAGTEPFLPSQARPLEVALAAYTSGSAWVCHRDDAGMVEPGAVADLVLLDRDPFDAPEEVGAARVERVWIGGEAVVG
jgi:predicted amidohydrolase YtcJ